MTRDSRFVVFVLLYGNNIIKSVFNLPSKNCVSRQTLFCKVFKQTFPNFKTHIIHMRASSNGSYFRNCHQATQKIISMIVSDKVRLSSKFGTSKCPVQTLVSCIHENLVNVYKKYFMFSDSMTISCMYLNSL